MKKFLIPTLVLLVFGNLLLPQLIPTRAIEVAIENPLKAKTFAELIQTIIEGLRKIALVLAPLLIVIGGYYLMMAGGKPESVATGKKIILYTIVGLVIIIAAEILIGVLIEALGKKG